MNLLRMCVLFFPMLVDPFHIYGRWIQPVHNVQIDIGGKTCRLMRDDRIMSIDTINIVQHPNNTLHILMKNPRVIRPPSDWNNVVKYARHISYFRRVQRHGVCVQIDWVDHDRIIIHSRIYNDTIPSLEFIRKKASPEEETA